ncbi:MAG: hypothetical protein DRJ05_16750 [Bacteroidetes bacterium]|nr:MAG: hypothetical protein DRJ05_16750 [Bacteroidota bacterium]
MDLIESNKDSLKQLCVRYNVAQLYVFGSVTGTEFRGDSDIDFLVKFVSLDLKEYADNYFDFKFSLEDIFNRKIDLLEDKAIKNPYLRESIDMSKKLIYG